MRERALIVVCKEVDDLSDEVKRLREDVELLKLKPRSWCALLRELWEKLWRLK